MSENLIVGLTVDRSINHQGPISNELMQKFLNYIYTPSMLKLKMMYSLKNDDCVFDTEQFLQNYLNHIV